MPKVRKLGTEDILNELKEIKVDTSTDDRVFDDRMDSMEDDDRESLESMEAEFEKMKATYLPPKLIEKFEKRGVSVRWIRYLLQGKVDRLSIQKALRRGYEYIRPDEIKEFQKEMPSEAVDFTQGEAILAGDLVLMRCKTKLVERRRNISAARASELESVNDRKIKQEGFAYKRKSRSQKLYKNGSSFGNDSID